MADALQNHIDGAWVDARDGERFDVFDPATGEVIATAPDSKAVDVEAAIDAARGRLSGARVLLTSPRGDRLDQRLARELAGHAKLIIACGRYEGVDERVRRYVDREISVGDFVLSAGDPAAWCIVDSVVRLIPGVLGNTASTADESFSDGLLEYPHYTRPWEYEGEAVPEVLRSGDHARIAAWRRARAEELTKKLRPDLLGPSD